MTRFKASLGARERLVTYGVGYGVGMGVPLLRLPLPFVAAFGLTWFLRPAGFGISCDEVSVLRPIGPKRIPLRDIRQVRYPAAEPEGAIIGPVRVDGIHGRFGTFWNRDAGRYAVYVTNVENRVELQLEDDTSVFISPDDPEEFVRKLHAALRFAGARAAELKPFDIGSLPGNLPAAGLRKRVLSRRPGRFRRLPVPDGRATGRPVHERLRYPERRHARSKKEQT